MFAKIINGAVAVYPYSVTELQLDHPGESLPDDLTAADLTHLGVVKVAAAIPPADTTLETAVEGTPALVGGVWTQTWSLARKPVPASVSMAQARLALLGAGMLSSVDAVMAALPSPQKEQALIWWTYAGEVRRDHPLVSQLAAALNLTSAQVDDLFITASTL